MHKYDNPYLSAFEEFKDKYLILYIGTLFSVLGVAIVLKTISYDEALNVYLLFSMIAIVLSFFFLYGICFKRIEVFSITITSSGLEINNMQIPVSEIQEVYTTKSNELVIITNYEKYKIFRSLCKYNELLNNIKSIALVKTKSDAKNKIIYALDFFLFIFFFFINIPYIVVPVGLYLLFSSIIRFVINAKKTTSLIGMNLVISILILVFIVYKLILHFRAFM